MHHNACRAKRYVVTQYTVEKVHSKRTVRDSHTLHAVVTTITFRILYNQLNVSRMSIYLKPKTNVFARVSI